MLFATAVKFLAAKDAGTQPLSYKSIADKLTSLRWTEQDAELWTQIFCNCVTSIVPAANTYTGDASWLVNAECSVFQASTPNRWTGFAKSLQSTQYNRDESVSPQ
jgi:hypothetical protein